MSCIVGYVDSETGNIYMGSDSAGVIVETLSSRVRPNVKIFEKGNMLFGVAGSFRVLQILRYSLNIPEQPEELPDYDYMCTLFIKALRESVQENECFQVQNEGEVYFDGSILVGYKGELYKIEADLSVTIIDDFEAVGCGEAYALGSMYTSTSLNHYNPKDIVTLALKSSGEYSMGVRPPYVCFVLKNNNEINELN